jgi:hypothetical protein
MSVASVRFPDGWREFRYLNQQLQCGDIVTQTKASYRVVAVSPGRHGYHDVTVELETMSQSTEQRLESDSGSHDDAR